MPVLTVARTQASGWNLIIWAIDTASKNLHFQVAGIKSHSWVPNPGSAMWDAGVVTAGSMAYSLSCTLSVQYWLSSRESTRAHNRPSSAPGYALMGGGWWWCVCVCARPAGTTHEGWVVSPATASAVPLRDTKAAARTEKPGNTVIQAELVFNPKGRSQSTAEETRCFWQDVHQIWLIV